MITRLTVSNYRSLGSDVDIQLDRLTVFVGPNGSGKSNVLDVLRFLADSMRLGLEGAIARRHGIKAVRRVGAGTGRPYDIKIAITLDGPTFRDASYELVLTSDGIEEFRVKREQAIVVYDDGVEKFTVENGLFSGPTGISPKLSPTALALPIVGGDGRFRPLVEAIEATAVYTIFPDTLRQPQPYDPTRPMNEHGGNWASVLRDQLKNGLKPELIAALRKLTTDIDDIRVEPLGGFLLVQFSHSAKAWFDAGQESDGTLRVAGIITALLQEPPLGTVGIEEPELTVHPGAIRLLHDYINQATTERQVLITTHSPELLDLVSPEAIRVVERRGGVTTVQPLEVSQRDAVRSRLVTLGEVMRTEGIKQLDLDLPG